jgi:hypothetical protein
MRGMEDWMMIGMITRWVSLFPYVSLKKMEDGDEEMDGG